MTVNYETIERVNRKIRAAQRQVFVKWARDSINEDIRKAREKLTADLAKRIAGETKHLSLSSDTKADRGSKERLLKGMIEGIERKEIVFKKSIEYGVHPGRERGCPREALYCKGIMKTIGGWLRSFLLYLFKEREG